MRPVSLPAQEVKSLRVKGFPLPLVYLLAVSGGLFALFSAWAYDDPFITYRYAENLVRGLGFVYNPGERVLSTTTPLFTLLLAFLGLISPNFPVWANLIGAASLAAGGLLLWDLARSWQAPAVGWAGLLLYPTFPLLVSTLGSETPLYLALCLGAFAFYGRGRTLPAALCAALAVLARPDGVLVAGLLAGDFLLKNRGRISWREAALFSLILVGWAAFAWLYFGSPLPVTLAAKQQQGEMAVSQRFAPGFLTILGWYARLPYLLEAGLALVGCLFAARRARTWLLFLAWPLLYFLAYSALGVSRYYWYYAPLLPGFIAAVGLGIAAAGAGLRAGLRTRPGARLPAWERWGAFVLLGLLFLSQAQSLAELRVQADRRYPIYRAVGEWLESNTLPGDRVGALEVGIIGYYARRPMVDFAGLIQPEIAARLGEGSNYEDAALWAVENYQPEYLVLPAAAFPRLEQGPVEQACDLSRHFPGEPYGYNGSLEVYACRK
jgi:hypothetical protein